MPEQRIIKCPFCEKGDIITVCIPEMPITKHSRGSDTTMAYSYFTNDKYDIISIKCPNCNKTGKEIEDILKEGKQPFNESIIKRLKKTGLDLSKLK